MRIRFVFATLLSAGLLGSCSSPSDIRPEVAQPLNEARVLANGGGDRSAIMAKINQAASVPNLSGDERQQIVITRDYALSRAGRFAGGAVVPTEHGIQNSPNYSQTLGYTGLRDARTY